MGLPVTEPLKQPAANLLGGRLKGLQGQRFRRNMVWFFMALPALVWIFIFKYVTLFGIWIAFTNYKARRGVFGSDFIGLKNFEFLFATDTAIRATRNTVLLNILFITAGLMVALFVAWLMFEIYSSALTKFYQTMLLLPRFISWVIASYFVFALLATDNGLINGMLSNAGAETVSWYSSPEYWPAILLFSSLWNNVGISSLIYLAGMLAIDPQLFEAARIDGAGKWQQFLKISLPMIMPLVVINLLLAMAGIFSADFGLFFQIPRNQPLLYPTTDVLDTFIYRSLLVTQNVSMAAAAQFYQSIVGFVLVLFFNWVVRRIERHDEPLSLF
ncbi:MAG: sugar ABC transporter permease [Anaerolineaceae bacterium]|nr:sugar ABC transporter permease [Anaerolineaceae bacterium]